MTAPRQRDAGPARPREISLDGAGGRRVSVDRRSDFDDDRIFPGRFVSPRAMSYWYYLSVNTTFRYPARPLSPLLSFWSARVPAAPSPSASSPPRVSPRDTTPDASPTRTRFGLGAAARVPTPRSRRPETPPSSPPRIGAEALRTSPRTNASAQLRNQRRSKHCDVPPVRRTRCRSGIAPRRIRKAHHAKFSFLPEAGCAPTSAGGSPSTLRSGSARPRAKTKERASPKNSGLEVRDSEETPPSTSRAGSNRDQRRALVDDPRQKRLETEAVDVRVEEPSPRPRATPRHAPERNQATNGVTRRRGESRVRSRGTPAASARTGARDPPERGLDKRAECVPRRGAPTRDVSGKIVAVDERARERRQRDPRERVRRALGFADGELDRRDRGARARGRRWRRCRAPTRRAPRRTYTARRASRCRARSAVGRTSASVASFIASDAAARPSAWRRRDREPRTCAGRRGRDPHGRVQRHHSPRQRARRGLQGRVASKPVGRGRARRRAKEHREDLFDVP